MELTLFVILILIIAAAACEFLDSSLGMLYGTILSPVLIIAGFDPLIVVPSILFSQAMGGFTASIFHHRLKNADFKLRVKHPKTVIERVKELGYFETLRRGLSRDLRDALCIVLLGIIAVILSVLIAINIPRVALETYIGTLVFVMGAFLLSQIRFKYTWKKMLVVGALSAFNKGMSGGGFGPVVTSGQVIAGRNSRSSIGVTTLAEAPICIAGFLTYLFTKGISGWFFTIYLCIGAIIGALIGPRLTARFKNDKKLRKVLGVLVLILGIFTLLKVLGIIKIAIKI